MLDTPQFSNLREVVGNDPTRPAIAYPTFSPDSQWIAFNRATQSRTRGAAGELCHPTAETELEAAGPELEIGQRAGDPGEEQGIAVAQAVAPTRREQLEERIHASRAALEEYVASSLHSAEELAKLSRRRQREPGFVAE